MMNLSNRLKAVATLICLLGPGPLGSHAQAGTDWLGWLGGKKMQGQTSGCLNGSLSNVEDPIVTFRFQEPAPDGSISGVLDLGMEGRQYSVRIKSIPGQQPYQMEMYELEQTLKAGAPTPDSLRFLPSDGQLKPTELRLIRDSEELNFVFVHWNFSKLERVNCQGTLLILPGTVSPK